MRKILTVLSTAAALVVAGTAGAVDAAADTSPFSAYGITYDYGTNGSLEATPSVSGTNQSATAKADDQGNLLNTGSSFNQVSVVTTGNTATATITNLYLSQWNTTLTADKVVSSQTCDASGCTASVQITNGVLSDASSGTATLPSAPAPGATVKLQTTTLTLNDQSSANGVFGVTAIAVDDEGTVPDPSSASVGYASGGVVTPPATTALTLTVTGSQEWSGTPTFTGTLAATPSDATVDLSKLTCTRVLYGTPTPLAIDKSLEIGDYQLVTANCSGAKLTGVGAANYTISYVDGGFSVTEKPVVINVIGRQVYGGSTSWGAAYTAPPGVTVTPQTDKPACDYTSRYTAVSPRLPVDYYYLAAISCYGFSISGPDVAHYTIKYVGRLTVLRRTVTVTASAPPVRKGQTPAYTYSVTGLVNNDKLVGTPTYSASMTVGTKKYTYPESNKVGTYWLYVKGLSVPSSRNYKLEVEGGRLYVS